MSIKSSSLAGPNLSDIIRHIRDCYNTLGYNTPIFVGEKYLKNGGEAPRIVIVPDYEDGSIEHPLVMGHGATHVHTCKVIVFAKEGGDDITRLDHLYVMSDRVVAILAAAMPGRIEWGAVRRYRPTTADAFGVGLELNFRYRRDIEHDLRRWLVADQQPLVTKKPLPPPGEPTEIGDVEATVEPAE